MAFDFSKFLAALPVIITGLSIFIEISPVKISPLTMLFNWIGEVMLKDLKAMVLNNTKNLEAFKNETNRRFDLYERQKIEQKAADMRNEIINFSENLRLGRAYSAKQYEYILDLTSEYYMYCENHKIKNHVIDEAHAYIREASRKLANKREVKENEG